MQNKSSKKTVIIIIAIIIILMLCTCSCGGLCVALGVAGSLPKSLQNKYDENDWYWDKYVDENKDSVDGNYPNGDIENWWWTTIDAERQSYIDENGYPYSLYSFDWESKKFDDGSWYNETDCVFPNGDAEDWWYTIDKNMRQCYIFLHGIPYFLYEDEGEWEETGWYKEENCNFPNGNAENWWDSASNAMKDCYTWTYGLPDFLYSDLYYEDDYEEENIDNSENDLTCVYELDCELPNGDIEFWWDDASEAKKACFVNDNGYPYKDDDTCTTFPNGDIETWWCSTDTETRLCYIDVYGLPSFME